jgi:hypothetical protein
MNLARHRGQILDQRSSDALLMHDNPARRHRGGESRVPLRDDRLATAQRNAVFRSRRQMVRRPETPWLRAELALRDIVAGP